MPTRFCTTPLPPRILTPAASDHATRTRYTGILGMVGSPRADISEAMTRGKRVYPMIHMLCAKDLRGGVDYQQDSLKLAELDFE